MNKLSVGQRLAILVGLPLAIIVLLVISSLSSFSSINEGVGRIYDNRVVPLTQLKAINDSYTTVIDAINKADKGLIIPSEALQRVRTAQREIRENWNAYSRGNLNEEEQAVISDVQEQMDRAERFIDEANEVLASMGDSLQYDLETETTLVYDYARDMFDYVDPISGKIDQLIRMQLEIAQQERQHAQQIYDNAFTFFIAAAVIAALVMVLFGAWVARSISTPLSRLRTIIEEADQRRDLTVQVGVDSSDEIGQVASAFQRMITRFRDIIGNVRHTSSQLQDYAGKLSNTTELTREGVTVQTRETDQVATASTQMTHAIEEVSRNAHQAADAASNANRETISGKQVLEQAIGSINSLSGRIASASDVINRVDTDSAAIGSVLDVIRGIAEQTNLLALNAAIEAARAGEQGRGFAVVADEVRSLAQRTQESTQEIQEMIERLQAGAQEAVKSMAEGSEEMERTVELANNAGDSLATIAKAVELINDMNSQIASATEEQMTVSQEISRNVVNISDVAKSSEHSVEEVEQASRELRDAAAHLSSLVNEFATD